VEPIRPKITQENTMERMIAEAEGNGRYYELGMMYASGRAVPADLVNAHKWFNIAAVRGDRDAARMRAEISAEMAGEQIASAQRAAREWLRLH
jgi:TPR repeat protein